MRALTTIALVITAAPALAQPPAGPLVHPLYAEMPGSMRNADAKRAFSEAAGRAHLGPLEVMDIPAPAAPRAPELLKTARVAAEQRKFPEAEAALGPAVDEVMKSGGAGLSPAELSELFLTQAMTIQKAGWNELEAPLTELTPPAAREAYLRAAVLAPDRVLERRRYPPIAIASFQLAAAEVKQGPRASLTVKARPHASVSIDGADRQAADNLAYGEHFVRVEEVGYQPWTAAVTVGQPAVILEAPNTAPLVADDGEAARQAHRQGAAFALLSMLKLGPPATLELHLIDAQSGQRRDATVVPLDGEAGALDAAIMRLDGEARRLALGVQPDAVKLPAGDLTVATVRDQPAPAAPAEDPGVWARKHWPLLTAIGAAVGTAIVLGIAVASDSRTPR